PVTPNPARGAESILQNPLGTALSNNSNALVRVAADGVGVVGLTLEGDPGTTGAPNTFATFGVLAQDAGTLLVNGAPTTTTFSLSNLLVKNNIIRNFSGVNATGVSVGGTNANQWINTGATGANATLFAGTTGKDVAGSNRVAEPAASTGNTVNSNLITDVPI